MSDIYYVKSSGETMSLIAVTVSTVLAFSLLFLPLYSMIADSSANGDKRVLDSKVSHQSMYDHCLAKPSIQGCSVTLNLK